MRRALTARQQRFVAEYVVDLNATKAAIRAGYSEKGAQQAGSRLLLNVVVAAELAEQQGHIVERIGLTAADTLEELRRVMLFDPAAIFDEHGSFRSIHNLPPEVRSCIASVEVREIIGEDGACTGRMVKLKFWSKTTAIAKAMDHFALAGGPLGALSLPPSAEQLAKEAETTAQLEALLKEKQGRWHGNVMPLTPPTTTG
jgi:phage terminase small subunit